MTPPSIQLLRNAFVWTSGFAVDADGAPKAYAPLASSLRGLDYLANAGHHGNWWGLVCNSQGNPVVQGPNDPAPGFYVSTTALCDHSKAQSDPHRYVDSSTVPYVSVPPELRNRGVLLGDTCVVVHGDKVSGAVVADVGPRNSYGEGSIALAEALGIPSNPRTGGVWEGIIWAVFRASSRGWPRTVEDIQQHSAALLSAWGGVEALKRSVSSSKDLPVQKA